MIKLKLFCVEQPDLITVVEEQLLYFGLVNQQVINNNNTFRDINKNNILDIVEYTDVENCDFIYYPYKIHPHSNLNPIIELSKQYDKKILLFYNDDNETYFNFENTIMFKTSISKSKKSNNHFSVPAFCNDLKKETKFYFRKKEKLPTIGFCGALTHPLRLQVIEELKKTDLPVNFIIRDNFWGGNVWGPKVRSEYIQNTLDSDIVICLRGAGNFSYRFYETICLGRIPLVLDTDLVFPFDDFINYDKIMINVRKDEFSELYNKILFYWDNIENYEKLQKQLMSFWDENLSPIGFIKKLNEYKNEINNILY